MWVSETIEQFLAGRTPVSDRVVLVSGRASFELVQKALMDSENMANVQELDPEGKHRHKTKRMTDFCSETAFEIPDVPDPYYGAEEGFEFVADLLTDGCRGVLGHIGSISR